MTRLSATTTLVIALGLLALAATSADVTAAPDAADFRVKVDKHSSTITTKNHVRFTLTFTSVGGFDGEVNAELPEASVPPGAKVKWSGSHVRVSPGRQATTVLSLIMGDTDTPPGVYRIAPQGVSGSVTHAVAPDIVLTVTPPAPVTATLSPEQPIVGVTQVLISGQATPGEVVVVTSTFPDGVTHQFPAIVSGAGTYRNGPFVLRQLGTYHDVLRDTATGSTAEISYEGVGDFSTSVDRTSATVAREEEAKFEVTFKSLSGFAGRVKVAVPDLSRITGATASWSSPAVTVPSGDSTSVGLTIKTSSATPPGTYKINVQGTSGSVTHAAPSEIELTVKE